MRDYFSAFLWSSSMKSTIHLKCGISRTCCGWPHRIRSNSPQMVKRNPNKHGDTPRRAREAMALLVFRVPTCYSRWLPPRKLVSHLARWVEEQHLNHRCVPMPTSRIARYLSSQSLPTSVAPRATFSRQSNAVHVCHQPLRGRAYMCLKTSANTIVKITKTGKGVQEYQRDSKLRGFRIYFG